MYHPWKRLVSLASHYDIRATEEHLYLAVLACRKAQDACAAGDLSGTADLQQQTGTDVNRT
jgi:hypothetical protein